MGFLSLVQYLNRKSDLKAQTNASIQEIEARKRAEIEKQNAELDATRRAEDIRSVTADKEMMENLYHNALLSGNAPDTARNIAEKQFYAFKSSAPTTETATNKYKSTAADYGSNRISGAMPYAAKAGEAEMQNELLGQKVKSADQRNALNTAIERSVSMPRLGVLQDQANISKLNLEKDLTDVRRLHDPNILNSQLTATEAAEPSITSSEIKSTISGNNRQAADNEYRSTVLGKLDPGMAAQAENAGYGSARDVANLVSKTKGALTPGFGNPLITKPDSMSDPLIQIPGLTQLLQNAFTQAPASATATNVTPRGKVLFNLRSQGGKYQ